MWLPGNAERRRKRIKKGSEAQWKENHIINHLSWILKIWIIDTQWEHLYHPKAIIICVCVVYRYTYYIYEALKCYFLFKIFPKIHMIIFFQHLGFQLSILHIHVCINLYVCIWDHFLFSSLDFYDILFLYLFFIGNFFFLLSYNLEFVFSSAFFHPIQENQLREYKLMLLWTLNFWVQDYSNWYKHLFLF